MEWGQFGIGLFLYLLCLGAIIGFIFLIHFLFTLPMRRAERARLFLELLEGALNRGQSVEEMILSIAQSRDRTVGIHFHFLAAHVESGLHFIEALKITPRFLPPQISAMLAAGNKLGDLKRILPACREILRDRPKSVRSAMNYLILVLLVFSPVFMLILFFTNAFVVPKFRDVAAGMGIRLMPESLWVFGNTGSLLALETVVSLLIMLALLVYIGGPHFMQWFKFRLFPLVDWIAWRLPWKQKRLLCTFSAMLSVLLDGGVPEGEAVSLAGACTSNEICRRRASRVVAALETGETLDVAVRGFDESGEFRWRLANAAHSRGGFLNAMRGWHEALEAKAFQQEEATAHLITSGVVIFNGALVALIAIAMFGILVAVLNGMLGIT